MENGAGQSGGRKKRKKLTGRAFYESIGSPKYILAPMVDQSEFVSLPTFPSHLSAPCPGRNLTIN